MNVVTKKAKLSILHTIDPQAPVEQGVNEVAEAVAAKTGLLAADVKEYQ